ncbi:hypothetical protein [Dyadobacter sp. 3J3]|uniref:hypothetical protein n=1 Tax=Dyadobacter sp. 3J3 TaxID=2606600 RepID=UPI001359C3BF|nr:hypothetical protein [Dyadobacter sp. 3J3]
MSKKNPHIKKYLNGKLPEPEVQADDAWGQLNDMLGQTSVPDPQLQNVGKFKYFLKYGLGFLSGVAIVTATWLVLPENKKEKTNIKSNLEQKSGDSIVFNDALEEIKTNIPEKQIMRKDSLSNSAANIENNTITGSLTNDKTNFKPFAVSKN